MSTVIMGGDGREGHRLTLAAACFQLGEFLRFSEGEISERGRGLEPGILLVGEGELLFASRKGCTWEKSDFGAAEPAKEAIATESRRGEGEGRLTEPDVSISLRLGSPRSTSPHASRFEKNGGWFAQWLNATTLAGGVRKGIW